MINWLMQKGMQREAEKIAKWAADNYKILKEKYPNDKDAEIFQRMFNIKHPLIDAPEELKNFIKNRCVSIEGLCYTLGITLGPYQSAMVLRCSQFTKYMDDALYRRGFEKQSKETKLELFKSLNLLVEGYERFL